MSKAFNDRINFEGFVDCSLILQLIQKKLLRQRRYL